MSYGIWKQQGNPYDVTNSEAGLMLSEIGGVGFKVDNFNRENMGLFESNWHNIKQALILTVQLVSRFGFSGQNLSAHNAILPISYYLYRKSPGEAYLTHNRFERDRQAIREWLIRSLLKSGVWGSGLDTLLTSLRRIIQDHDDDDFPVARIRDEMARRGRSLVFEEEELEDLADMEYSNRLTFALLSLVFPFVDLNIQFHIDHIFPRARFTVRKLRAAEIPDDRIDEFVRNKDRLANLQLLVGASNNEERTKMPAEWLSDTHEDNRNRREYEEHHLLGNAPETMTDFGDFYDSRRNRLRETIGRLLGR